MATRSMIGMLNEDNTVTAIYCHWDGYPENNGLLLIKYWREQYLVEQLMDLGNISSLGKEIGEEQDFDQPTDRNWCLAYGRDRKQADSEPTQYDNRDDFVNNAGADVCADYIYLWEDGVWHCWDYNGIHVNLYEMYVEN